LGVESDGKRLIADNLSKAGFGGTPEIMLSFPSVELGAYVREKNLHADAMVRSDPFSGFRVQDREELQLRD